jgi:hypothetical protein
MDYRSRFPVIPRWSFEVLNTVRHPLPYVYPGLGGVEEIDAPDGSTIFLSIGISAYSVGERDFLVRYLIEAPPSDLMRASFERGELPMEDFAAHRGWLIRIENEILNEDDCTTSYIHPLQMDKRARDELSELGEVSPYEYLLSKLFRCRNSKKRCNEEYLSFENQIDVVLARINQLQIKLAA